jgi:type IX secretion system PorP/SprF family membrane protein
MISKIKLKNLPDMKYLVFTIIFLLNVGALTAQQLPIYAQNQDGNYFTNAAMLRKNDLPTALSVSYRHQWVKLDDAPRTIMANFSHFNEDYNVFFGGGLIQDQTGPTSFTGVSMSAGYAVDLTRDWQLSMALSAGVSQYRIKAAELDFLEEGDIAQANQSKVAPDLGMSATIYYDKKYFVGVSVPQILGFNLDYSADNNDFELKRIRHYYANGGALFEVDDSWLEASAFARFIPSIPVNYGAHVRYEHENIFWVGVGGSSAKSGTMEGGLVFDIGSGYTKARIGYAFTNFFASYSPNFGTVHDIKVSFAW